MKNLLIATLSVIIIIGASGCASQSSQNISFNKQLKIKKKIKPVKVNPHKSMGMSMVN